MSERDTAAHGAEPAAGHELRDVSTRPIVTAWIGLGVVILVVLIAMRVLYSFYAMREAATSPPPNPLAAELARNEPPLPRLQAAPIEDLRKLRSLEDSLLDRYSWVDREKGIVRLPIERAMELLAERGLAARQAEPTGE